MFIPQPFAPYFWSLSIFVFLANFLVTSSSRAPLGFDDRFSRPCSLVSVFCSWLTLPASSSVPLPDPGISWSCLSICLSGGG
ncbi:hypothetical protein V8F20_002338, partial [Naviculisporaceae sp. PSN 640]